MPSHLSLSGPTDALLNSEDLDGQIWDLAKTVRVSFKVRTCQFAADKTMFP